MKSSVVGIIFIGILSVYVTSIWAADDMGESFRTVKMYLPSADGKCELVLTNVPQSPPDRDRWFRQINSDLEKREVPFRMIEMHIPSDGGMSEMVVTNMPLSLVVSLVPRLVSQFEKEDRAGTTAYHSDRDAEIKKCLLSDMPDWDNARLTVERQEKKGKLLAKIPLPSAPNNVREVMRELPRSRRGGVPRDDLPGWAMEMERLGILPVWTGNAWADGMPLVLNGFGLEIPVNVQKTLFDINWLERSRGPYFYTDDEIREMMSLALSDDRNLPLTRVSLACDGYDLKFDKTFYIWRVTATNAPRTTLDLLGLLLPESKQEKMPPKK